MTQGGDEQTGSLLWRVLGINTYLRRGRTGLQHSNLKASDQLSLQEH